MLESFSVYRDAVNHMDFPLVGDRFVVSKIDGQGPTKAALTSRFVADAGKFEIEKVNLDYRTITISLLLKPDWSIGQSVQDLRNLIYDAFPEHKSVELRFYDSVREDVKTVGWVKAVTPDIFTADPKMDIVISCPDAYFSVFASTTFPAINAPGTYDFVNPGSAPVGFDFQINYAVAATGTFKMAREDDPTMYFKHDPEAASLLARHVSTVPGAKIINNGATKLLYEVDPKSTWLWLKPGSNRMVITWTGVTSVSSIFWWPKYSSL